MLQWFNNAPIRTKLGAILTLTAMSTLLFATVAIILNEYVTKKQEIQQQLVLIADIIEPNISASLAFKDAQDSARMLSSLKKRPSIRNAELYDNQKVLFASYWADGESATQQEANITRLLNQLRLTDADKGFFSVLLGKFSNHYETLFLDEAPSHESSKYEDIFVYDARNNLHFIRPLFLDGELIGILHLVDDQSILYAILKTFYFVVSVIVLFALVLISLITRKMQKIFLGPLLSLMEAMASVTREKNFSHRIHKLSNDEFGDLTDVYNEMLSEIQIRDDQLTQYRNSLEEQVASRTRELGEKNHQLEQTIAEVLEAKKLAEQASHAKSQFLATMSHEIRTPMNGVMGMTELLMSSGLTDRQTRLAETAHRSANSLLGIINNILDFSKIEARKLQLVIKDFNLRALLEETMEMLADQANRKGIELVLNISPDFHYNVQGDAERLRQVLVNLLGNAIKFTQTGEVQLKLTHSPSTKFRDHVKLLFEVVDTGIGIAHEQQEIIFDSFTQSDGSITRQYGGTGLGLTISRQLVELMAGDLKLESRLGQGTRFYFTVELGLGQQAAPAGLPVPDLKNTRILVVDDNPTHRGILQYQLSLWGAQVTSAGNGARALKLLLDAVVMGEPYQVVLLDWRMPVMDGLSVAKAIQKDVRIPQLKLVMVGSESDTFQQDENQQFGIDFCLAKPIFQNRLRLCMLEVLGKKPQPDRSAGGAEADKQKLLHRILVAEDNPVNQEVVKGFLENLGCKADIVSNGKEAVSAAILDHYDMILMDCHMPVMDGFAATSEIRREATGSANAATPIIALTADVQKGIQELCLNAGMNDYLSKPFSKEQLKNCINKWIKSPAKASSEPSPAPAPAARPAGESVIQEADLMALREIITADGISLMEKTIGIYLDSSFEIVDKLRNAIAARDLQTIAGLAHTLKSASANVGARKLSKTCEVIEKTARAGEMEPILEISKKFREQYDAVQNALKDIMASA